MVLKKVSQKPVRLLDVRDGRRPDSYYQIILEQNGRALKDLPRAISDPGPILAADYFVLAPGATIETTISTTADLSAVPAGSYSAYVCITIDPFGGRLREMPFCAASFDVKK